MLRSRSYGDFGLYGELEQTGGGADEGRSRREADGRPGGGADERWTGGGRGVWSRREVWIKKRGDFSFENPFFTEKRPKNVLIRSYNQRNT